MNVTLNKFMKYLLTNSQQASITESTTYSAPQLAIP